jgi:hypothetical protein
METKTNQIRVKQSESLRATDCMKTVQGETDISVLNHRLIVAQRPVFLSARTIALKFFPAYSISV